MIPNGMRQKNKNSYNNFTLNNVLDRVLQNVGSALTNIHKHYDMQNGKTLKTPQHHKHENFCPYELV